MSPNFKKKKVFCLGLISLGLLTTAQLTKGMLKLLCKYENTVKYKVLLYK